MHRVYLFDPSPLLHQFGLSFTELRIVVEAFLTFHSPAKNEMMFCKTPTEALYYVFNQWLAEGHDSDLAPEIHHTTFNAFRWLFNYLTPLILNNQPIRTADLISISVAECLIMVETHEGVYDARCSFLYPTTNGLYPDCHSYFYGYC